MACNVTDGQEDKVIDTRFGAATRTHADGELLCMGFNARSVRVCERHG